MYKSNIILGVVPAHRAFLDLKRAADEKKEFMRVVRSIRPDNVTIVDIDDICEEGILCDEAYSPAIVSKFIDAKVDAIFVPFCDFGDEGSVADVVSKFKVPVLVWGARDPEPNTNTARGRDTQCGMFAATKVFRRFGVTYSYIFNEPAESETFRKGFENFLRVANVLKDLRNLRIGKIGERPAPFRSVLTNEANLMTRFGIQVVAIPPIEIKALMDRKIAEKNEEFQTLSADLRARMDTSRISDERFDSLIGLKMAVRETLEKKGCSAAAIECWPTGSTLGFPACAMIGELTDIGIPVACETDINGAITMAILRAAQFGDEAEFLADLTIRNPEHDNSELLWHCGPFPYSLKAADSTAYLTEGNEEFRLRQGELTLCRFDDDAGEYYLFAGEAKTTTGPETNGTYVYIETDDWKKWEEHFMFGPYIHHLGGVYAPLFPVLREVARYLGIHFDYPDAPGPKSL